MKHIYFLAFLILSILPSQAQTYVTIPDANFVAWLQTNVPSAMNGNQMDITDPAVTTLTNMNVSDLSISDLSGVEYFSSLSTLACDSNQLSGIAAFPGSLDTLFCSNNLISSFGPIPSSLRMLICNNNNLTALPLLPDSLRILYVNSNQISNITSLPMMLAGLNCIGNGLNSISSLPVNLRSLICSNNNLSNLPSLPATLETLYCHGNLLSQLPALPSALYYLSVANNLLTELHDLPNSLHFLDLQNNQIDSLPTLPASLLSMDCSSNLLTSLPLLPTYHFMMLICDSNQLTSLPALPPFLGLLECSNNMLSSLPSLPDSIEIVSCMNNQISCFPVFPSMQLHTLKISGNPFTCLPNYVPAMDSVLLSYPICVLNDGVNNPNNCDGFEGSIGRVFHDNDNDCLSDSSEYGLANTRLLLSDGSGNQIGQFYTSINGTFSALLPFGSYTITVDTAAMPFHASCLNPGIDSTVTLDSSNMSIAGIDFPVVCNPGFDVGVQSVSYSGIPFPGQTNIINVNAGDMSQWYNLHCASGISGEVQVTISGPVSFVGIAANALVPAINGNVFTYTVSDFGLINNAHDFGLMLSVDTNAQSGDTVCIQVSVSPVSGDNNPLNNTLNYCYSVVNSFDPNSKEVYPSIVPPGYEDYLTYTIHFQNVGTYSALSIRIKDVLDENLDPSTFQLAGYSHNCTVSLTENELYVWFPAINLPDSASNPEGSCGFIQYRIKPVSGLPSWTHIPNTAAIYFDYNTPVVTNTATCIFGYQSISENNDPGTEILVFPNPAYEEINISGITCPALVAVYDISGKLLISQDISKPVLNIGSLQTGMYFLEIRTEKDDVVRRFLKE